MTPFVAPVIASGAITQTVSDTLCQDIGGEIIHRQDDLLVVGTGLSLSRERLTSLRQALGIDVNQLPVSFEAGRLGLVLSDMDSTFINIECVDEIADFAGIKPQVAKITEAAMRGEIDFKTSLTRRVGLLAGLDTSALEKVYRERLRLNPGAAELVNGLRNDGIPFALVSGGFTFFTERLKQKYRLDFTRSNTLEIIDNKLTGKLLGDIVDGEAKAAYLEELCRTLGIECSQTVVMGDGANDLLMMKKSGLSVAYRAKPVVQAQATVVLSYSPLNTLLSLFEYSR